MTTVNLKIRHYEFALETDDPERAKMLAARLESRMNEVYAGFNNASDLKLAIMAGILLEDQIDTLAKKLEGASSTKADEVMELKRTYKETFNSVAHYLEQLANKIEKS